MLADDAALERWLLRGGVLKALPRGGVHASLRHDQRRAERSLGDGRTPRAGQDFVAAPVLAAQRPPRRQS